jgi:hypothetical protein
LAAEIYIHSYIWKIENGEKFNTVERESESVRGIEDKDQVMGLRKLIT